MATVLVIIHGLVAVALLGAITHQTLAVWAPATAEPGSFFGRFRAVQSVTNQKAPPDNERQDPRSPTPLSFSTAISASGL
jgi:hypothetical protein